MRHLAAIPLAMLAMLALVWLMKTLIETRSIEDEFEQPPARIVFISNDQEEINNPEPPSPKLPEQPDEPEPEPEPKPVTPEPPKPEPEPKKEKIEEPLKQPAKLKVEPVKKVKPKKRPKKKRVRKAKPRQTARAKFDSRPLYRPKPSYPTSARRRGVEGYVLVRYTIAKSGAVRNVGVISARPPSIFNSAAIRAVSRWRYKPQPVDRPGMRTKINFVLRGRR